jgi:hypothetical protein
MNFFNLSTRSGTRTESQHYFGSANQTDLESNRLFGYKQQHWLLVHPLNVFCSKCCVLHIGIDCQKCNFLPSVILFYQWRNLGITISHN